MNQSIFNGKPCNCIVVVLASLACIVGILAAYGVRFGSPIINSYTEEWFNICPWVIGAFVVQAISMICIFAGKTTVLKNAIVSSAVYITVFVLGVVMWVGDLPELKTMTELGLLAYIGIRYAFTRQHGSYRWPGKILTLTGALGVLGFLSGTTIFHGQLPGLSPQAGGTSLMVMLLGIGYWLGSPLYRPEQGEVSVDTHYMYNRFSETPMPGDANNELLRTHGTSKPDKAHV